MVITNYTQFKKFVKRFFEFVVIINTKKRDKNDDKSQSLCRSGDNLLS
jgi:hypothetical protein